MPEFLHPPYAATAKQYPKQLNRWLDVNAQNGPLERNQAYFVLPAFDQEVVWNGYSDIAIAFNFEGPNNFSLKYLFQGAPNKGLLSPIPSNPDYSLAVAWIDKSGKMQRRFLWIATGAVFYFATQLYTNEKILKNFRLEVWTVDQADNVTTPRQAAPITLFTSVRGTQDYRFGTDFALIAADVAVTDFSANYTIGATPIIGVKGCGSIALLGAYLYGGITAGKPFYIKMDDDSANAVAWTAGDNAWNITDNESGDGYISFDNVATPDLVTTWTSTNFDTVPLPLPIVQFSNTFALQLTFPANSVPQAN